MFSFEFIMSSTFLLFFSTSGCFRNHFPFVECKTYLPHYTIFRSYQVRSYLLTVQKDKERQVAVKQLREQRKYGAQVGLYLLFQYSTILFNLLFHLQ